LKSLIQCGFLALVLFQGLGGADAYAAQGTSRSTSPARRSAPPAFQMALELEVYRGFDQFDDNFQGTALQPQLNLSRRSRLVGIFGYDWRMRPQENGDETNFKVSDSEILWRYDAYATRGDSGRTSLRVGLGTLLPTSESSQAASLRAAATGEAFIRHQFRAVPMDLTLKNKVFIYNYEFETTDVQGTSYNHTYDIQNILEWETRFTDDLALTLSAGLISSENYFGHRFQTQVYLAQLDYALDKNSAIFVRGKTKDRIETNNNLFDDDNSQAGMGLTLTF
jgi:hypothetical protein